MKRTIFLSLLLFLSAFANAQGDTKQIAQDVDVATFKQLMAEYNNEILLDVRTQNEVDSGAIKGAQHIDYFADDFKKQLAKLDKSKTVLVYCAAGGRSGEAMSIMKGMGFEEVYNLLGGYGAWTAEE